MSNKDTIIEALEMQLKLEREGNLALVKREWVGLTDEERNKASGWSVKHIEEYLKEKNT